MNTTDNMNKTLDYIYTYEDGTTTTYGEMLSRAFNDSGLNTTWSSNSIFIEEEDKRRFDCLFCQKKFNSQHGFDYHNKTRH